MFTTRQAPFGSASQKGGDQFVFFLFILFFLLGSEVPVHFSFLVFFFSGHELLGLAVFVSFCFLQFFNIANGLLTPFYHGGTTN